MFNVVVRAVLLVVIAIVLVEAVIGITTSGTGVVEKAVILGVAVALVAVLPRVRRIGAPHV